MTNAKDTTRRANGVNREVELGAPSGVVSDVLDAESSAAISEWRNLSGVTQDGALRLQVG